jgi:signal transduction histidine kinase
VWAEAADGGCVRFTVADTGIGIAPEHQDTIFTEFGQIEGPQQLRSTGTGLGLPLSRALAQLLGGTLTLRSEAGVGSTFVVEIPANLPDPGDPAAALERAIEEVTRCP